MLWHNDCGSGYCEACRYQDKTGSDSLPTHNDCGGGGCEACQYESSEEDTTSEEDPSEPFERYDTRRLKNLTRQVLDWSEHTPTPEHATAYALCGEIANLLHYVKGLEDRLSKEAS